MTKGTEADGKAVKDDDEGYGNALKNDEKTSKGDREAQNAARRRSITFWSHHFVGNI